MKRILALLVAIATPTALSAQFSLDLGVVGRFETHPSFFFNGSGVTHDFGGSSIYTTVESSFGEHVSFNWVAHWASTDCGRYPFESTPSLYRNVWRSDSGSFTDYLYFDFSFGGWTFRLGKDCIFTGGFEYLPWDWEVVPDCRSYYWQNTASYQWGGLVRWDASDEANSVEFQAVSSPWGERPWQDGLGHYGLRHSGTFGNFTTAETVAFEQTGSVGGKAEGIFHLLLGLQYDVLDNLALSAEWSNRIHTATPMRGFADFFKQSQRVGGTVAYSPVGQVDILLKGGWERIGIPLEREWWLPEENPSRNLWYAGIEADWYPLRDSRDLCVKAVLASNAALGAVTLTAGILYNHTFSIAGR